MKLLSAFVLASTFVGACATCPSKCMDESACLPYLHAGCIPGKGYAIGKGGTDRRNFVAPFSALKKDSWNGGHSCANADLLGCTTDCTTCDTDPSLSTRLTSQCMYEGSKKYFCCENQNIGFIFGNSSVLPCRVSQTSRGRPETIASLCSRCTEVSEPKVVDACDHTNCHEWSCDQWCTCFKSEFETVYEKLGCADGDTCQCK